MDSGSVRYVKADELEAFVGRVFYNSGLQSNAAHDAAYAVIWASLHGVDSHGLRLVPHYLRAMQSGRINAMAQPLFRKTAPGAGVLDAEHGIAHAALTQAVDHASELASENGVASVAVRNSNHCGALGAYATRGAEKGYVTIVFTNATAKLRVHEGLRPFFGINPMAVSAPMANEAPFCYDSAPAPFSNNKVKMYAAAEMELPAEVAADADGQLTLDPRLSAMLIPLGGELFGYKGVGLAAVADLFCGILTGMPNGPMVSTMYPQDGGHISDKRLLGQWVTCVNIASFVELDEFKSRMQQTADALRSQPCTPNAVSGPLFPGDPEKKTRAERLVAGIPVPESLYVELNQIAETAGLPPLMEYSNEHS